MDKMTFASYKFKPSDVIEGLNRYFAEAKAFRYCRVPLEIRNGEVKPGNYYVLRNIVFVTTPPKVKELGYYYLICDPEEVVGVAINWLREEHNIFYTPGMNEPPIKDPDDIFCMENLDAVPIAKVREALGIAEDSDIFQCIKYRNHQLETLRTEVAVARRKDHLLSEQTKRLSKLANLRSSILKVYREIFDCSNGEPEGTDEENLQDILTEYQRVKELNDRMSQNFDYFANAAQDRWENLVGLREKIYKTYLAIHPNEVIHKNAMDTLDDILEEYKSVTKKVESLDTALKLADQRSEWLTKDVSTATRLRNQLKEELRSVNESFEYQTSELCKILGLDAGSPPEDILEAVEELKGDALVANDLQRQLTEAQVTAGKFRNNIRGALGLNIKEGCTDAMVVDELRNKLDELSGTSNGAMDALRKLYESLIGPYDFDDSPQFLAAQISNAVSPLLVLNLDYANAKYARAELAKLYKEMLGVDRLDPDLSPHEIATRIKRCFAGIKSREQKNKMISDNHAKEANELKRELETVREDLIEWIKGLRSVYTNVKGHEPPLEATPSATASVCKYEIDAMKQKLNDIKDICDGNSDVMNIIG